MARAFEVARGPHLFTYDNINISTSIFTEQRGSSTPGNVQSGTVSVIYKLRAARLEDMHIEPMLKRFQTATELNWEHDICATSAQFQSFFGQLTVIVANILTSYSPQFASYKSHPQLQHPQRRCIPLGHKTEYFPLRTSTIEEASIEGNLAVHEDVYIDQLKFSIDHLSMYAIPSINDQSTNARIRGGVALRQWDLTPWDKHVVFQLAFGLFHLCLNLVWAILHTHRGTLKDVGSLTYFFSLADKARLGNHHPDYHSLLAALTQIVHGLILNAWRRECGFTTLEQFAESAPTPDRILELAAHILHEYATPEPPSKEDDLHIDPTFHNVRLLTRDLLYVLELVRAISDGDWGRIEDFLPQLAMMFRGAGSNNYCSEILHFLFNLKKVWTPEFAYVIHFSHLIVVILFSLSDIMRDNMIINISGLPGHAMPVDLNIEHVIGYLKVCDTKV